MKRGFIGVVVFFLLAPSLKGQSRLSALNPLPRVGQEIEIEVSLSKGQALVGTGIIKLFAGFDHVGFVKVGPFSIELNNELFLTDSLQLPIEDKLRSIEGIWIRFAEIQNDMYLIIEERIPAKTTTKNSDSVKSLNMSGNKKHFEFLIDKLEELDFEIGSVNSSTKLELVENPDSGIKVAVSYRIEIIKFRKSETSLTPVKIDASFFKNVTKVDSVWIK